MKYKPVLQVVKQYETILQEIGDNVPAGMPDLANDFVHALSEQLQRKLLKMLERLPPYTNYMGNVSNFNEIVQQALNEETDKRELHKMFRSVQHTERLRGPVRPGTTLKRTGSTFMTQPRLTGPVSKNAFARN